MAAHPAAAGHPAPVASPTASQTLAAPFAMSSAATSTPAVTPDARMTFAAPRLPLPIWRRSDAPHRRASISAQGIDPLKYAARITRIMFRAARRHAPRVRLACARAVYVGPADDRRLW